MTDAPHAGDSSRDEGAGIQPPSTVATTATFAHARCANVEVRRGEPNDEYHANETHRSCSRIKTLLDSPALYYQRYIAKTAPPYTSSAMDHGTLLHRWFEEGDDLLDLLVVPPKETLTATLLVGKEANEWAKKHAPEGAVIVSPKEHAQILAEVAAANRDPKVRELRERATEHEISVYWTDSEGHNLKCRFDMLTSDGIVVDLKTTREEYILADFPNAVARYRYHLQDAWYQCGMEAMGLEPRPLHFVVISTAPSHDCRVITLPEQVTAIGRQRMQEALADLRLREDLDWWLPDQHGEVIELQFPAYVLGRL